MDVYSETSSMRHFIVSILFTILCGLSGYGDNYALLVGIGNYNTKMTGWTVIHGNNDVALLSKLLVSDGFSVKSLVDNKATKENVVKELNNLEKTIVKGDRVYIHFSGHGQLIEDVNNDEQDDYDQSFVCYDACYSPNYNFKGKLYLGQNHLIDDELFPFLNRIKIKLGSNGELVVVFDSCYSGDADRNEILDDPEFSSLIEWSNETRGSQDEFRINKTSETYLRKIKTPSDYSPGAPILVISACERNKKNYECRDKYSGRSYGSLSYCISQLLKKNVPFNEWEKYFMSGSYKSLKIFRPSQTPEVRLHK